MLSKLRILFWVGVLLLFVPHLGFKSNVKTIITILLGGLVIWISFRLRMAYKEMRFRLRRLETPEATPELNTNTS